MTGEPGPTAPGDSGRETAGLVARLLGEVLGRELVADEWEQTFKDLDVDSVRGAEFVGLVNAACGVATHAPDLLDHPTPHAFARYLTACRESRNRPRTLADQAVPAVPARAAEPRSGAPDLARMLESLRALLAETLCCDPWELDPSATFAALDLDSVSGAEFVASANLAHGLTLRPTVLFDSPSLAALAAHVTELLAQDPGARSPGR